MRPLDLQLIGMELAVKWDDGVESLIRLETLRRRCPCAGCAGETDVMGNVYKAPETQFSPRSFQLVQLVQVGGYAIQPVWGDGHGAGLYSYEYLRRIAEEPST